MDRVLKIQDWIWIVQYDSPLIFVFAVNTANTGREMVANFWKQAPLPKPQLQTMVMRDDKRAIGLIKFYAIRINSCPNKSLGETSHTINTTFAISGSSPEKRVAVSTFVWEWLCLKVYCKTEVFGVTFLPPAPVPKKVTPASAPAMVLFGNLNSTPFCTPKT